MGTLSNKYFNAQAVEEALDKGVAAYDNMGQIELVYNGTDIRFNNEVVNFQQIVDYIITDTRFCYMVYNNRVLLTSDMQLTGGTRYVFFETSTTDSGLSKNTVVKVYSADGTAISSISHSTIANENFSNKVSTIADNDKNSTVHYPSNKAVTEITDEIKEDLNELGDGSNLIDISTITENVYIDGVGQVKESLNHCVTDFIEVYEGIEYRKTPSEDDVYHRVAFYDDNMTVNGSVETSEIFTTPIGTKYIRVGYLMSEMPNINVHIMSAKDRVARKGINDLAQDVEKNATETQSYIDKIFYTGSLPIDINTISNHVIGNSVPNSLGGISIDTLDSYETYYLVIDKDVDVYFDTELATTYVALCVGQNYRGIREIESGTLIVDTSGSVRYRKSENNLPTFENPVHINTGDFIAITLTRSGNDKIYGLDNIIKIRDDFKADVVGDIKTEAVSEAVEEVTDRFIDETYGVVFSNLTTYTDVYDGYYAQTNGMISNENYISYGLTVTKDTEIYVQSCNTQYFSICVYDDSTKTLGVRYRKTPSEDTLPYENNPINVVTGKYIVFSVHKGNRAFSVMFSDYIRSSQFKNGILLSDEQIAQVKDLGSNSYSFIRYEANPTTDRTEQLAIYFKNNQKYTKWLFVHTVLNSINSNVWRIQDVYGCDDTRDSGIVMLTSTNAEWEMAVHLADAPDFIGGRAHGSEVMSEDAIFLLDGKVVDISELTSLTEFRELIVFVKSNMYDPSDEQTLVGEHIKRISFKDGVVRCEQYVKWFGDFSLTSSYMAMSPPLKTVTNYWYRDSEKPINNGFPSLIDTSHYPANEKCENTYLYGSDNGFWCRFSFLKYPEISNLSGYAHMTDNGGGAYNKCYYYMCATSGATVSANDVWHTITEWEYRWN